MPTPAWRIGVLGPVTVDGATLPRLQRNLLALLASRPRRLVTTEEIIEALWPGAKLSSPRNRVQWLVAALRRVLSEDGIATRHTGYELAAPVDAEVFERLAAAREAGSLGAALDLWRGPAFHDATLDAVAAEAKRLDELRTETYERFVQARLDAGEHAAVLPLLQGLVAEHRLRHRLRGQLMLALYRGGRQPEALAAYREGASLLVAEQGLDMPQELRTLHERILRDDPGLSAVAVNQLPAGMPHFSGRTAELSTMDKARGIIAITGGAGVGKTSLAVHWAGRNAGAFPDGVLFINLAGYAERTALSPLEVLQRLLRSLGVPPPEVPSDVDEAAAVFRGRVAGKRVLLLLDDARNTAQIGPLLPGGDAAVVLVTSRHRLTSLVGRHGATAIPLGVFDSGEAAQVLGKLLGAARTAGESEAAAELAGACGHLPLALSLAAGYLAGRPAWRIGDLLAELRRSGRLDVLADDDDETSVRAAFDLSYRSLEAPAQRLFRMLALHPGREFGEAAAAELAGDAPSHLDRLLAVHLLEQPTPRRYVMHDLLREYGARLAPAAEEQTVRESLLAWYADRTAAASRILHPYMVRLGAGEPTHRFDDAASALSWLDSERANLVACAQAAARLGPRAIAWQLATDLRGYFLAGGHIPEWTAVAQAARDAATDPRDPTGLAVAAMSFSNMDFRRGLLPSATKHMREAVGYAREAGWAGGLASASANLSDLCWHQGQTDEAVQHLTEALDAARRSKDKRLQANMAGMLAAVNGRLGRIQDAADALRQAIALDEETGPTSGQTYHRRNLAEALFTLGDPGAARVELEHAMRLAGAVGDRAAEASNLVLLARIHCATGHHGEAERCLTGAAAIIDELQHHQLDAALAIARGEIALELKRVEQARAQFAKGVAVARQAGNQPALVRAHIGLARVALDEGDGTALDTATAATRLAESFTDPILLGEALAVRGQAHLAAGAPGQARADASRALAAARETGHRAQEARCLVLLGSADPAQARECWTRALDILTAIGLPQADSVRARLAEL